MSAAAGVCLALAAVAAAGDASVVFVPQARFTLAWTHSIEKTRWEEDYMVRGEGGALRLHAVAARVRGAGAGMEPPAGAVRRGGWYEYRPATAPLQELLLTRSGFTPDYEWCADGACRPLGDLLPSDGAATRLWPCTLP